MTAPSLPTSLRRQAIEHNPWTFASRATAADHTWRKNHLHLLARHFGVEAGKDCFIAPSASISGEKGRSLTLGRRCYIAAHAYITEDVRFGDDCTVNPFATVRGRVVAGDGVRIGAYTCIVGFNHGFSRTDIPAWQQPCTSRGITLGSDVWIGSHVTIVDGVTVGSHTILAAGAVVTKDVPDYAIVGGNPARVLRLRSRPRPPGSLEARLEKFGRQVSEQLDATLRRYQTRRRDGSLTYVNAPRGPKRVRPVCDAIELASMFGRIPAGYPRAEWITRLRDLQDPVTSLVPEHWPDSPRTTSASAPPADAELAPRYDTMIVNYALECLGGTLAHPVANAHAIGAVRLRRRLSALPWENGAWAAGDWIDGYASTLLPGVRDFGRRAPLRELFRWLDAHCNATTGLWGHATPTDRLLQPVNGFYRLTRGTYAQYNRPLPFPERAVETILHHAADPAFFSRGHDNACNVLDVVHPLWLCLRQTQVRRPEIQNWVKARLGRYLRHWVKNGGFDFHLSRRTPTLQGTEMWLSILWFMADLLDCSEALGYRPRGVHRPEPSGAGFVPPADQPRESSPRPRDKPAR